MRNTTTPILLLVAGLMLASCSQQDDAPPPKQKQGRAETQGIRNTEAIGYSGNAIADKVDSALNANDQQKAKMDKALESNEK
jgi:PBP1b-binding outer membrane lipoprotein LpoB